MRKVSRVQRLARKEESAIIKRIVWLSIFSVIIIVLIFTAGIPLLGGFADLLGRVFGKNTANISQAGTVPPPILESLPAATNSAGLTVSGFASNSNKVEIFLNSDKAGEADVADGKFNYEALTLQSGDNVISAKSLNESGKESDPSQSETVTLDTQAPKLSIDSPSDGQTFSGVNKIKVAGSSDPNAEVLANGFLANVAGDGKFEVSVPLSEGENTIEVKAIDNAGNTTTSKIKVNFHP